VAREDLTKSWTLHPQHPAAAHQMIRVCLGRWTDPGALRSNQNTNNP